MLALLVTHFLVLQLQVSLNLNALFLFFFINGQTETGNYNFNEVETVVFYFLVSHEIGSRRLSWRFETTANSTPSWLSWEFAAHFAKYVNMEDKDTMNGEHFTQ